VAKKKKRLARRRATLAICVLSLSGILLLCVGLLILRYVDIPGTQWDNFLDMTTLIKWELKLKAMW
jgi:hypothetical protein